MLSIQHRPQSCQNFIYWLLLQGKPSLWNSILEPEDNAEQSNSDTATAGLQSAAAPAQQAQHGRLQTRDHSLDSNDDDGDDDKEKDEDEEGDSQEGIEEEEDRNKTSNQQHLNTDKGQSQPSDVYDMRKR